MGDPFDDCNTILEVLGQLAGSASVCWIQTEDGQVFHAERAEIFVHYANERIKQIHRADLVKMFEPKVPIEPAEPEEEPAQPEQ